MSGAPKSRTDNVLFIKLAGRHGSSLYSRGVSNIPGHNFFLTTQGKQRGKTFNSAYPAPQRLSTTETCHVHLGTPMTLAADSSVDGEGWSCHSLSLLW